jgi:ribonuclease BN (tRNA processing enzyme)
VQATEHLHPGKVLTYRLQYGQATVVYSTDHGIGNSRIDAKLVTLAQDTDLWILDGMYTPEECQDCIDRGHSSHLDAVQLALQARAKTVVLFHHSPDHDDKMLDRMGREAADLAAGTPTRVLMARDGLVLDVGKPESANTRRNNLT